LEKVNTLNVDIIKNGFLTVSAQSTDIGETFAKLAIFKHCVRLFSLFLTETETSIASNNTCHNGCLFLILGQFTMVVILILKPSPLLEKSTPEWDPYIPFNPNDEQQCRQWYMEHGFTTNIDSFIV